MQRPSSGWRMNIWVKDACAEQEGVSISRPVAGATVSSSFAPAPTSSPTHSPASVKFSFSIRHSACGWGNISYQCSALRRRIHIVLTQGVQSRLLPLCLPSSSGELPLGWGWLLLTSRNTSCSPLNPRPGASGANSHQQGMSLLGFNFLVSLADNSTLPRSLQLGGHQRAPIRAAGKSQLELCREILQSPWCGLTQGLWRDTGNPGKAVTTSLLIYYPRHRNFWGPLGESHCVHNMRVNKTQESIYWGKNKKRWKSFGLKFMKV